MLYRSSTARSLVLLLATPLLALGCKSAKQASNAAGSAAPAGSPSALAAAAGPCAEYAKKICDKAGAESTTCASFKTATELMSPAACEAGLKDVNQSIAKLASLRGPCDALVKQLCSAVGEQTESCTLVKTQTQQFPVERCKMMQEHVPEIVADLKKMEAAKAPLSPELASKIAASGTTVPSFGPENAKVQIVEFSDFQCPYCSRAASVVHQIKEKYGNDVHFVFRQFPLDMHPNAREAAEASLAAHAQGKFWDFHDRMFKNQQALDRASLESHAKEAGLNVGEFKKALDDDRFAAQVETDLKLGQEVSVQGTPTLFINGQRVDNPTDFQAVASMIDSALGKASPG